EIRSGPAIRGNHPRLSRVSRIALLDGYENEQPRSTRFMTPHARHVRHTRSFQFPPDHGRPDKAPHVVELTRWPCGRRAKKDRIIPTIKPLHLHDRLRPNIARVPTRPLAQRP